MERLEGRMMPLATAVGLGPIAEVTRAESVGPADTADVYRFSMAAPGNVTAGLRNLSANAQLELVYDRNNNLLIDSGEKLPLSLRGRHDPGMGQHRPRRRQQLLPACAERFWIYGDRHLYARRLGTPLPDAISSLFAVGTMSSAVAKPWKLNSYTSSGTISSTGGFEGVLDGTYVGGAWIPQWLLYISKVTLSEVSLFA